MWLTRTRLEDKSRVVYRISVKEPTSEEYQKDKKLCSRGQNLDENISVITFYMKTNIPLIFDETPAEYYHRWGFDYDGNNLLSDTQVFNKALTKTEILNIFNKFNKFNKNPLLNKSRCKVRINKKKQKSKLTDFGKCYIYKDSENKQHMIMPTKYNEASNYKGEKILKKDKITICISDPNTKNITDQIDANVPDIFNVFDVCELCNEQTKCKNCIVHILQSEEYIHKDQKLVDEINSIIKLETKFNTAINIINNCKELDMNIEPYCILKELIPEVNWDKFKKEKI